MTISAFPSSTAFGSRSDILLSCDITRSLITTLTKDEVTGPSDPPNCVMVVCPGIFSCYPYVLLGTPLSYKEIPSEWKTTNIIPIYRNGQNTSKNVSKYFGKHVFNYTFDYNFE